MPCTRALTLAGSLLAERLPVLERSHPGDEWARRTLAGEKVGLPAEYAGPGSNSLVKGIEHLVAARGTDDEVRCRAHIVEAIAEAVMAVLIAAWGARHPQQWADWYARSRSIDTDDPPVQLGLWGDPATRELSRVQWEAVADRLGSV
jgi:hypothetical protein